MGNTTYSAGNLELQLTAISKSAIDSLGAVKKALSSLSTTLGDLTGKDLKWINSFGTKLKNFSKKMSDLDWSSITDGFNKLTVAITPFIDKIASAQSGLVALNETLKKVSGKKFANLDTAINPTSKVGKGGFGGFNFKRLFNVAVVLRFGRAVSKIVQYGVNFTETLNLWQVAMRENLDQADEFIKKMNRAYGISQQTLMNAQATFKNMIGSLGNISDQVAYQLSESILQMATDFSSLYNVTFEQAITKFQAALAGQVRPIRSGSGYDITENTLYQLYQQLGGTKTQRQLNRTEKQLLAIYAVFQQMQRSGAVGDLSKTLGNFANQSRMMTENFKELATYTGLFFQDLLQSWGVLKYINAGIIFLTEIMKALTNYKAPNFLENMFESVTDTNDAVDELQGKLLDFDKFRALDSSAGMGGSLALDEKLVKALTDYQSILSNVKNEARELATTWLETIGFTRDENGELKIANENLQEITKLLAPIKDILQPVFTFVWDTLKQVFPIVTSLLTTVAEALSPLSKIFNQVFTVVKNIVNALLPVINILADALDMLTPILNIVKAITFVVSYLLNGVSQLKGWMSVIIIAPLEFVLKLVETIVHTLGTLFTWDWKGLGDKLKNIWSNWRTSDYVTNVSKFQIPKYANGASDIDRGALFYTGEAGKVEAVYTGSNGKTNVANIAQMREANYQGTIQAMNDWWATAKYDIPRFQSVSSTGLYQVVDDEAKRRGKGFAKR